MDIYGFLFFVAVGAFVILYIKRQYNRRRFQARFNITWPRTDDERRSTRGHIEEVGEQLQHELDQLQKQYDSLVHSSSEAISEQIRALKKELRKKQKMQDEGFILYEKAGYGEQARKEFLAELCAIATGGPKKR